jgi:hypothetical protein
MDRLVVPAEDTNSEQHRVAGHVCDEGVAET